MTTPNTANTSQTRKPQPWLFTIEQTLDPRAPGQRYGLWSDPQHDSATGEVRRRADGGPYTPAWTTDDDIVVYHPASGVCVARVRVKEPPVWNPRTELFDIECQVWRGPARRVRRSPTSKSTRQCRAAGSG